MITFRNILCCLLVLGATLVHGQQHTYISVPGSAGGGGVAGQDSIKVAIIQHREADGVDYPNTPDTVAWKAKLINTEVVDEIGVSIIGDTTLSIPAGKYLISYTAINSVGRSGIRLRDISGTTLSHGITRDATHHGTCIANGPVSIQVQYWTPSFFEEWDPNTLGLAHDSPDDYEVYTEITIIKLQ